MIKYQQNQHNNTIYNSENLVKSFVLKPEISYLIFLILQLIALFTFTAGFLQVRDQFNDISTTVPFENTTNWFEPQAKKVIIVLIDALRFEFLHYNENVTTQNETYCQNKFKELHESMLAETDNYNLFRGYADSPTVTTQRVKCLMTGNIPSFIEVANNFGGSEVNNFYMLAYSIEF